MLFPALYPRLIQANLEMDAGLRYGLRFGVSLMVGWTVLLFWVDRKPVARKGVLLITFYPVVVSKSITCPSTVQQLMLEQKEYRWWVP